VGLSNRSALLCSDDGGQTWDIDWAPDSVPPISFDTHNSFIVALAADYKIYYQTLGAPEWAEAAALPDESEVPDPYYRRQTWAVWIADAITWLCPVGNTFARTEDAGMHWTIAEKPPPGNGGRIGGACFVTERRGFTASHIVYSNTYRGDETTDAGASWTAAHHAFSHPLS
jgi:hypothetical protein